MEFEANDAEADTCPFASMRPWLSSVPYISSRQERFVIHLSPVFALFGALTVQHGRIRTMTYLFSVPCVVFDPGISTSHASRLSKYMSPTSRKRKNDMLCPRYQEKMTLTPNLLTKQSHLLAHLLAQYAKFSLLLFRHFLLLTSLNRICCYSSYCT